MVLWLVVPTACSKRYPSAMLVPVAMEKPFIVQSSIAWKNVLVARTPPQLVNVVSSSTAKIVSAFALALLLTVLQQIFNHGRTQAIYSLCRGAARQCTCLQVFAGQASYFFLFTWHFDEL